MDGRMSRVHGCTGATVHGCTYPAGLYPWTDGILKMQDANFQGRDEQEQGLFLVQEQGVVVSCRVPVRSTVRGYEELSAPLNSMVRRAARASHFATRKHPTNQKSTPAPPQS